MIRLCIASFVVFGVLSSVKAAQDGPCGIPPPPSPKRIKGGEGVPPLPLPATPLRRTERKRDPAPPTLIGKIVWGENRILEVPDGRKIPFSDWNHDPNDVHRLLQLARNDLKIHYREVPVALKGFSFEPAEIPILYVTGTRAIAFGDEERARLREFLIKGGFLLGDACRGSDEFAAAFRAGMARILPEYPLQPLPPDHPIYSTFRRLDRVAYSKAVTDRPDGAPFLEGARMGCRIAAVLTKYDLSCAWDSDHLVEEAKAVIGRDAYDMGLNILSYALSYFDLGRFYARGGLAEPRAEIDRGDFVFAQLRHDGEFDPDPTSFATLLRACMTETNIGIRFRRTVVSPEDEGIASYPFLYMTGHDDFRLSDAAVEKLRRHLGSGGFLLGDACCGALRFDIAFRREIARVLPAGKLEVLPPDHALFNAFWRIDRVTYSPKVRATFGERTEPYIEGIAVDGLLRVVYSRFDLGCGWEDEEHPYARGVAPRDALRIGMNAIVYAMSH